jgi:catechol 1,2-dioxygenase
MAFTEGKDSTHKFNPHFTQAVINATGPKASPRVRKLTASLIQHLHDFARENELTVDEWMAGLELVRLFTSNHCHESKADHFR